MKLLITGSNGLVGKALQRLSLNAKDIEWIFTTRDDADLTSFEQTVEMFSRYTPTHVINLAAKVGGLYSNMENQIDYFRDNYSINDNIMRCCKDFNVKLVSILSTCIMPDFPSRYPMDETELHNGVPHCSNMGYAYSKRMIEVLGRCYNADDSNRTFVSVIPCNLYGPNDNFDLHHGHVIPSLIHKTYLADSNNTELTVFGSGDALRQFLYVDDFAKILMWVVTEYDDVEPLIISPDVEDEISIKTLIEKIITVFNFEGKIKYDLFRSSGQYKKTVTNSKFREYLPNFEFTPIDIGLKRVIKSFVEDYYK